MSAKTEPQGPLGSFQVLLPLIDYLDEHKIDARAILTEAGIPTSVLSDPDERIRRSQIDALWRVAIETTQDDLLHLRVALAADPSSIGIFGYLASTSESGRDAYERTSEIVDLMQEATRVEIAMDGDLALICLVENSHYPISRPSIEFGIGMIISQGRIIGHGVGQPTEARFPSRGSP